MTKLFARFLKDESGATAIEYGLIAALIALAIMAGATQIGTQLDATFSTIGTTLKGANTAPATP
jgi:pilus assembly protein Flp/PilA